MRRREFHRLALSTAVAAATGCTDPKRYTREDAARLDAQRLAEAEQSGRGRFGQHRYQGYRGLADLPWFELDPSGNLVCTVDDLPPAIDFHCHFGMNLFLAPDFDLLRETDRVEHILDSDAEDPGSPIDLDVYMNANFSSSDLWKLRRNAVAQVLWGSAPAETHTIPNLIREMDQTRVARAVILPIAFGLPTGDDMADRWLDAIEESGTDDRFIRGASVHPRDAEWPKKLARLASRGAKVVKLHPAGQRFFPDSNEAMEVYEECSRLGLVPFFHGGRAGIEPEYTHQFTLMRNYEAMLAEFPEVPFVIGHAGARDVADAIPLAQKYPNAWLGTHGQGISVLDQLIEEVGPDRLLFGTDWPFYHLASSLAKVLIVTEHRPSLRAPILHANAERLLGLESSAS